MEMNGQEVTLKCIIFTFVQSREEEKKSLYCVKVTLQISRLKRQKKKRVNLNVFHLWLSVLPSEVFPE